VDDGDPGELNEAAEGVDREAGSNAAAGEDEGPGGFENGLESVLCEGGLESGGCGSGGERSDGRGDLIALNIHGDVDEDGAAATGGGDAEGVVEDLRKVFGGVHAENSFGDGCGHGADVGFLEAELADGAISLHLVAIDLAGDEDCRAGIEEATTDAGEEIGGAGAAGGHGDAGRVAEDAARGFGGEGSSLFVAHGDDGRFADGMDGVDEMRDHAADEFEDGRNLARSKRFGDVIRCLHNDVSEGIDAGARAVGNAGGTSKLMRSSSTA
jgi:hypothetical protein